VPCELFLLGYVILQVSQRKKTEHQQEVGSSRGCEEQGNGQLQGVHGFGLPQTTLERYVKDRLKSSGEAVKKSWVGSKFFLLT
jgi:hypothetical protein